MKTFKDYINEESYVKGKRLNIPEYEEILKRANSKIYSRHKFDSLDGVSFNRGRNCLIFWFSSSYDPDDGEPIEAPLFKLMPNEIKLLSDKKKFDEFQEYARNWSWK